MAITFSLKGDGAGPVKAVRDLQSAIEKAEKSAEGLATKLTKDEKAAERLAKQADPTRRYEEQMTKLGRAVARGGLELDKAQTLAERYGERLRRASEAGTRAFGGRAIADLRGFALQFVSVNAAISAAVSGLRQLSQEREQAAQRALSARAGFGELAQLAATTGDPAGEYGRLVSEARSIRARGGAESQDEAANILFSLVSAGLNREDRDFAVKLRASGALQNVGGAATAASALTTALGAGETGNFRDIISKSLAASSIAPALANEITQATTRSAGSARALGLSDEFLLAATAILGKTTGTASEGGTQLAAFLKQVEKGGLGGGTGAEIVARIAALSPEQQGIGGVLGDRAEAVQGFRTLSANQKLLRSLQSQISRAEETGLADVAIGLPRTDSSQRAAIARARAEGRLEVADTGRATLQNLVEAAMAERKRTFREESPGLLTELQLLLNAGQIGAEKLGGLSDDYSRTILNAIVGEGSIRDKELLRDIRDATKANISTRSE